jgi:hypothetical protein
MFYSESSFPGTISVHSQVTLTPWLPYWVCFGVSGLSDMHSCIQQTSYIRFSRFVLFHISQYRTVSVFHSDCQSCLCLEVRFYPSLITLSHYHALMRRFFRHIELFPQFYCFGTTLWQFFLSCAVQITTPELWSIWNRWGLLIGTHAIILHCPVTPAY